MNSTFLRRAVALALVPAMLGGTLPSQEPTFSTSVKVVNVLATVREKNGSIVTDLTKEDFQLLEDGRPQVIRYFSQETDIPLTVGLLVDTSLSQQNVLAEERAASHAFLNNMLREDRDQAFIIHFDFEVELLQDVTSSRRLLERALDELAIPSRDRSWGRNWQRGGSGRFPGGGPRPRGGRRMPSGGVGTLLYDAVYLAADEMMRPIRGRKALIILSDGEDYGSKLGLEEGVEAAQRGDTVVYSILYADKDGGGLLGRIAGAGSSGRGKRVLQQISQETGGRMFEVSSRLTIRQVYAQIEEELRNQYSLGYSSDQPATKAGYRKIAVKTTRKNAIVQARDGYYPDQQIAQTR